jgi:hypothetical protein
MGKRNTSDKMATSEPQQTMNGNIEENPACYVVVREGHRVSDKEYAEPTDPSCVAEVQFWTKVARNHSYGEKVEVVQYDSKEHRVW